MTDYATRTRDLILQLGKSAEQECVFHVLSRDILDLTGADMVSFWFFDECATYIRCEYALDQSGQRDPVGSVIERKDHPTYFRCIMEGVYVIANNVETSHCTGELLDSYFRPHGITALMDYVLYRDTVPVGVICCESTTGPRDWTTDDIADIRAVSTAASFEFTEQLKPIVSQRCF